MASANAEPNASVQFRSNSEGGESDNVKIDISSPAKNRFKGTPLSGRAKRGPLPILFERESGSWWNPRFDTNALEEEHLKHTFAQTQRRFQYALFYVIFACAVWTIFFAARMQPNWIPFVVGCIVLLFVSVVVLIFTYTRYYQRYFLASSIFLSLILCAAALASFASAHPVMSAVGTFAGSIEILLMMYTVIPMPLYVCVLIGAGYSVVFEILSAVLTPVTSVQFIIGKFLLHFCIHMIGIHIFIMSQVRKRSTFWKVGQSIMSRRELQVEKQIKEKMIHSLMPPSVARQVMQSREDNEDDTDGAATRRRKRRERGEITFRPFNMNIMKDVSILYADIVGFTKMSSNKTAEHLVSLLNDLFGRFDKICDASGCEKISTLGDCYYCVSGCPEPRPDHAKCCVEMGLAMCKAIKEFDEEHSEEVNMRVGVHTGTVLCGIVGTRRFKFDVFSNDVTLANIMESTGSPGKVHISEVTYEFLKDLYEVEPGEPEKDNRKHKVLIEHYDTETSQYKVKHKESDDVINTYFITKRKTPPGGSAAASPQLERPAQEVAEAKEENKIEEEVEEEEEKEKEEEVVEENTTNQEPENKEQVETSVQISPEQEDSKTDSLVNHVEGQASSANGMSAAALLGQRQSSLLERSDMTPEEMAEAKGMEASNKDASLVPINETLCIFREKLEKSDIQLLHCLKEDIGSQDYFYKPPINQCTLNFLVAEHEAQYRDHYFDDQRPVKTFASPRLSAFGDLLISFVFLLAISICCFLAFGAHLPWVITFVIAMLLELLHVIPLGYDVFQKTKPPGWKRIKRVFTSWYSRHLIGSIIATLPIIAVYSNFNCSIFDLRKNSDLFYCFLIVVCLLHYCNFTMLSSWVKSCLATLAGLVLLVLLGVGVCPHPAHTEILISNTSVTNTSSTAYFVNSSSASSTVSSHVVTHHWEDLFTGQHLLRYEIILDMALLLLLVWFLNHEIEISYRLSFHGDVQAQLDRCQMQEEKEQADWLLHNIIPEHVSEVLKKTSKYSKNHQDVGVIFATIINFHEMYDESFEGGREYLRVLSELVGDFEELFEDPKYKDVEKIKTIGSCFMGSSGLNPSSRSQNKDPYAHLYALMDFASDMQKVLERFNEGIFNFDFVMSIGFNYGEVTAGVIGTTKLLYDIWGDTVNIASRMYSTGVPGRIQVPEATTKILSKHFEFSYRGQIFVKGKDYMNTYLLEKKKDGATWE